jgi:hypothetical protein
VWPSDLYKIPQPSFKWPISPPVSGPTDGPCVCVSFSEEWAPFILGALQQLAQDATWRLGPSDDIQVLQGRVNQLMDMFGAQNQCGHGPAPVPPHVNPDEFDCGLAGYLVNEIVKQGMQSAIDMATGVGGPQAIIFHLLDFIPFGGDIVAGFGDAITDVAATVGFNDVFNWAQAQAEQALWNTVGCTVYSLVRGVHGFTAETWASLLSELRNMGGPSQPFFSAVADLLDIWGIGNANAIAELAGSTHYDCTGCGSGGGLNTTAAPLGDSLGLTVSDGTHTLHNVRDINVSGGLVGGTSDDGTLTIPAAWTLDVTDGTTAVIPTEIIQFPPGTVTNVSGVAVISGLEGPAGPPGPAGNSPVPGELVLWWHNDTDDKALDLGANDSETFAGSPPSGYLGRTFDDSAWPVAVVSETVSLYPEADLTWAATGDASGAECAYRSHHSLDVLLPDATLVVQIDAAFAALSFNDTTLTPDTSFDINPNGSAIRHTFDVSALLRVGDNVIALWAKNDATDVLGGVSFTVSSSFVGPEGPAGPPGPQGVPGSGDSFYDGYAILQDVEDTATNGGSAAASSWNTRSLTQTYAYGNMTAPLAANQFTLEPGTYRVQASAPNYETGRSRLRLYDTTHATTLLLGTSGFADVSNNINALMVGLVTVSETTVCELQNYTENAKATYGLGVAGADGAEEVFATIEFWHKVT